jgi:hypothetical protein
MTNETREFFDRLRKDIRELSHDSQVDVVRILRALRGPDIQNSTVKEATVERIRHIAFGYNIGSMFGNVSTGPVEHLVETLDDLGGDSWVADNCGTHFNATIQRAFMAVLKETEE